MLSAELQIQYDYAKKIKKYETESQNIAQAGGCSLDRRYY